MSERAGIRRKLGIVYMVLALLLVGLACEEEFSVNTSTRSYSKLLVDTNGVEEWTLTVKEGMTKHSLDLKTVALDNGSLSLKLIDPQENIYWQGEYSTGADDSQTLELPLTQGKWMLVLETQNANGKISFSWQAAE